jgi:transposase
MRCGIKSLSVKVNSSFTPEESESCLFIFCGRRKNSIKILEFSKDGVWLYQKVFNASRFRWPKYEETTIELEERQLLWLLDGLSIVQVKASKETGNLVRF